jgi:hypothetical protein
MPIRAANAAQRDTRFDSARSAAPSAVCRIAYRELRIANPGQLRGPSAARPL